MKFSLKKFKGKIAAGGQLDFNVQGDKVFAYNVPDGCKIKFDNGEAVELRTGIRYGVNSWFSTVLGAALAGIFPKIASTLSANVFNKISIVNETSNAVDVEILAGFGDIADDAVSVMNAVNVKPAGEIFPVAEKWQPVHGWMFSSAGFEKATCNYDCNFVVFDNVGETVALITSKSDPSAAGIRLFPNEKIGVPFVDFVFIGPAVSGEVINVSALYFERRA